jgi:hypothetical protein
MSGGLPATTSSIIPWEDAGDFDFMKSATVTSTLSAIPVSFTLRSFIMGLWDLPDAITLAGPVENPKRGRPFPRNSISGKTIDTPPENR